MKRSIQEWVEKAEDDFAVVLLMWRSRVRGRTDQICFHSQQAVEKYLKARLNEAGLAIPKTHDLRRLLSDLAVTEPLWLVHEPDLAWPSPYAVLSRYPDFRADTRQARRALAICRRLRTLIRNALGLRG